MRLSPLCSMLMTIDAGAHQFGHRLQWLATQVRNIQFGLTTKGLMPCSPTASHMAAKEALMMDSTAESKGPSPAAGATGAAASAASLILLNWLLYTLMVRCMAVVAVTPGHQG